MEQPTPYKEEDIENKFWSPEPWDVNLPAPGFVTDFVLATRGFNTPTKFCAWTALFLLSSVLKRDVELDWKPLYLYPNLYIFVIAPPYFCGKSSVIMWALENILPDFHKQIADPTMRVKKEISNLLYTKATPQGLFKMLDPKRVIPKSLDGSFLPKVDLGSNVTIAISELATFLGRSQHNLGLIQALTDLYDCKTTVDDITLGRGQKQLRNVYITLFGATTQTGLEVSVPEAALGEGFLSRVIILSEDEPTRNYSRPMEVTGGPNVVDLQRRLAWIAETGKGVYEFSPEAENAHERWNDGFVQAYKDRKVQPGRERDAIHVRKTALLLRVQRYEPGNIIELSDYQSALKLIKSVQKDARDTTGTLSLDDRTKKLGIIKRYLRRREKIDRRTMLMALSSRGILATDLNASIRELQGTEEAEIWYDGRKQLYPSGRGEEMYHWKGEK